jgi:RHS repeat-associated protein
MYENTATGEAIYIYGPTGRIAKRTTIQQESHTFYYHPDHLASTRLVTDESANIVVDTTYEPFGEPITTGEESYLYNGKELDETGLYYYGVRYYDPEIGRFITRDLLAGQRAVSQSLNPYTYCLDNPVKLIDLAGLAVSMCNVDTGVCIKFFEDGRDGWIAYDENGVITSSTEIEGLLDPTDKTEEKRIADQARATYLMLLVTHPEIEGDPNEDIELDKELNSEFEESTWFTVNVKINGESVTLKIGIDEKDKYIKQNGDVIYGFADVHKEKDSAGKVTEVTISIHMYQLAFSSLAVLFHVVGHEGQHAVDLVENNETSEKSAYDWNRRNDGTFPFYIPWPFERPIPSG